MKTEYKTPEKKRLQVLARYYRLRNTPGYQRPSQAGMRKARDPAYQKAGKTRRKHENMVYTAQVKAARGCVDCGYCDSPVALDFDHVTGKKVANVSSLVRRARAQVDAEIAKCEVRCANCHRIKTAERRCEAIEW